MKNNKTLSISQLAKLIDIPASTVRRYIDEFNYSFENKGGSRISKYDKEPAAHYLKIIRELYDQKKCSTKEIHEILSQKKKEEDENININEPLHSNDTSEEILIKNESVKEEQNVYRKVKSAKEEEITDILPANFINETKFFNFSENKGHSSINNEKKNTINQLDTFELMEILKKEVTVNGKKLTIIEKQRIMDFLSGLIWTIK